MTLAEAIADTRAGEAEGFACLFQHTVAHVWLAALLLGCEEPGTATVRLYRDARAAVAYLHSPSELRVWIGTRAYAVLLPLAEQEGTDIRGLPEPLRSVYGQMRVLPVWERTALLLLCGEGCSAPQAAEILSRPELEIKRAMRRARQELAACMKETAPTVCCNTSGLTRLLADIRAWLAETEGERWEELLRCVQTGEDYREPISAETAPSAGAEEEKSGFFRKLFRSRKFG